MHKAKSPIVCTILFFSLVLSSCRKQPYIADQANTAGFVIGREICKANELDDYWLIDLTYYSDTPQYGDTLILNGIQYTNVVKVKGLDERLRKSDMRVSLDFRTITNERVQSTDCSVPNPITYQLKELLIINQFEIR